MSTFLQILVVLVVLASFGVGYMSWKTWRIFQVILVVLILLATLPFYYMAARTLRIHKAWREVVRQQEAEIKQLEVQNRDLEEGAKQKDPNLIGIRQLKLDLDEIARNRGSVWRQVTADKVEDSGAVELSVGDPDPHGIAPKMVLFAFDQAAPDRGGSYLGEFQVTEAPDKSKSVKLTPNLPLDAAGIDRLKQANGPWTLYATMPVDDQQLMAGLSDAERKRLLPEESAVEFANNQRPLRDYNYLFWETRNQKLILEGVIADLNENLARAGAALKQAKTETAYRQAEQARLKFDLGNFKIEQTIFARYLSALESQNKSVREALRTVFFSNQKLVAEIAAMQLKAAEAINRRTAEQAQLDSP